jgi:uncharacterized RDD family membrane protein YckC
MTRALTRTVGAVAAADALAPQIAAAYVMLLALPFGVLVAIAGVLAWSTGYRPGQLRTLVRTRIIEERT